MGGSECTTLARSTKRFGFAQGCDRCQWRTGRFWKYLVESYRKCTAQRALLNYSTLFIAEKRGTPRNDGIYARISLRNQSTSSTVHGSIILHNMFVVWYIYPLVRTNRVCTNCNSPKVSCASTCRPSSPILYCCCSITHGSPKFSSLSQEVLKHNRI